MIFGNDDGRNYSVTLERHREVFSIELATFVQYTKYNKPYALRQQTSVRCTVASHCISFDKQAVSQ